MHQHQSKACKTVNKTTNQHKKTGSDRNGISEAFYLEHIPQYCTPHAADGARDAGPRNEAVR